jgi:fatty-acyl-CoA synthase
VWESVADAVPDQVALVQGPTRRTWAELDDRAARLASAFAAAGLAAGSKVAQYLYNAPEYLESYAAALKLRAVPVNVNYRYLDDELLYLLDDSDAEALIYHSSLADRVERIRALATKLRLLIEVDDGGPSVDAAEPYEGVLAAHPPAARIARSADDVTMLYTGGTTGLPKGVVSRIGPGVGTLMAAVPPIVQVAPLSEPAEIASVARRLADEDRPIVSMPACPLMHGTGLAIGAMPALTFGGRVVLLAGRGLDAEELWSTVERERVNSITIVGDAFARPMLRALQDAGPRQLDSLLLIMSAGAMFSAEVKAGLLEHVPGAMVVDYIAASEGAMGVSVSTKDAPAPTGRFHPNPGVKVLAEDGAEVAPGSGAMGMVAIAGEIPTGYYKDDEKTARTFRLVNGVRYSIPGDWATVETDGSIVLLGRGSQCINTAGEKVFPEEVEEVLKLHPAVEDCLVFGVEDERFGQRVAAVASLAPGVSAEPSSVVDAARSRLSSFKLPRQLVLVDTVPRAPNGKADYAGARRLFTDATVAPAG